MTDTFAFSRDKSSLRMTSRGHQPPIQSWYYKERLVGSGYQQGGGTCRPGPLIPKRSPYIAGPGGPGSQTYNAGPNEQQDRFDGVWAGTNREGGTVFAEGSRAGGSGGPEMWNRLWPGTQREVWNPTTDDHNSLSLATAISQKHSPHEAAQIDDALRLHTNHTQGLEHRDDWRYLSSAKMVRLQSFFFFACFCCPSLVCPVSKLLCRLFLSLTRSLSPVLFCLFLSRRL